MSSIKYEVEVFANGRIEWRLNGQYHREDGPAVFTKCSKFWYINGELHRLDGPACEYPGDKAWYIKGEFYTEVEFNKEIAKLNNTNKLIEIEGKKYRLVEEK